MLTVIFIEPDGAEYPIAVKSVTTARDAAVDNGVPGIDGDCGGGGRLRDLPRAC